MLIEICEDIVIAAEKNKKSAISALEKISFAYKYYICKISFANPDYKNTKS